MDLKNFVSEALYQIIAGIKAAQEKIGIGEQDDSFNKAYIAPISSSESESEIHDVYFDIALAVFKEESSHPSSQLHVLGLSSLSGKGSVEHMGSLVSRIQFSVPVTYPSMFRQSLSPASFSHHHYH